MIVTACPLLLFSFISNCCPLHKPFGVILCCVYFSHLNPLHVFVKPLNSVIYLHTLLTFPIFLLLADLGNLSGGVLGFSDWNIFGNTSRFMLTVQLSIQSVIHQSGEPAGLHPSSSHTASNIPLVHPSILTAHRQATCLFIYTSIH